MPANKKYLLNNTTQSLLKLSAGLFLGYGISSALHILLASFEALQTYVLIASIITIYLVWCLLIILSFIIKKVWQVWLSYLSAFILLSFLIYLL